MSCDLPEKRQIIGIGISATNYRNVVGLCARWSDERMVSAAAPSHYVCVTSVHGVIVAQDDPDAATALNSADIATPDGMPIVWALRSLGLGNQQRVYGPTLMLELCRDAAERHRRVFFYGSTEDTLTALRNRLANLFPKLSIAGTYAPPFRPLTSQEDDHVQDTIRSANPDLLFIGISTPKQEKWMYAHRRSFPGVTMIGVGAALDFHAGRIRQAPSWMQRNGLEWLFRLLVEPTRLWRRYLLITPRFLPLFALQRLRTLTRRRIAK